MLANKLSKSRIILRIDNPVLNDLFLTEAQSFCPWPRKTVYALAIFRLIFEED